MAGKRKTLNFLPSVFQTQTNEKFLGVTLDQLISEPDLKRVNGYIGRKFSPTFNPSDNYIVEPSTQRQNYQLEPTLVTRKPNGEIKNLATYNDLINKIDFYGGLVSDPNRLFGSEYYNFVPRIDLDKFVNFTQYYWLPIGPVPIQVTTKNITTAATVNLARESILTDEAPKPNMPDIDLVRGSSYTLNVGTGAGNIWIQSDTNITGRRRYAPSVSSRDVLGISQNGSDSITFAVPLETAQDVIYNMPVIDDVQYVLYEKFSFLDNVVWNFGVGMTNYIDGQQFYPEGNHVVFVNSSTDPGDWLDRNGATVPLNRRTGLWRMDIRPYPGQPARVELNYVRDIPQNHRIVARAGDHIGAEYYLNNSNFYTQINGLTSQQNYLYYINDATGDYGRIVLHDAAKSAVNATQIIGSTTYTLPSGLALSNGMRLSFDDGVNPPEYRNRTFAVEGVGKSIRLVDVSKLVSVEIPDLVSTVAFELKNYDIGGYDETSISGTRQPDYITINRSSCDLNAWSRNNCWYHIDVIKQSLKANGYSDITENLTRAQRPIIEFEPDLQLFNHGRIGLFVVDQLFDKNTLLKTAADNIPLTDALNQINGVDLPSLQQKGLTLLENQLVIFAAETAVQTRRNIYRVRYQDQRLSNLFDGQLTGTISVAANSVIVKGTGTNFVTQLYPGSLIYTAEGAYIGTVAKVNSSTELTLDGQVGFAITAISPYHNKARIELAVETQAQTHNHIAVRSGANRGKNYYLTADTEWQVAQAKTGLNQDPLFDIITADDRSISQAYAESSFTGTRLFAYKKSTTSTDDPIIGFPLSYRGIGNFVGDIIFDNAYNTDVFYYREDDASVDRVQQQVSIGYIRRITSLSGYTILNTFEPVSEFSKQYQHISSEYDGLTNYFEIGAVPLPDRTVSSEPNLKVFVNNKLLRLRFGTEYSVQLVGNRPTVKIDYTLLNVGDKIDILFYSDGVSDYGYYSIPNNLEYNPENITVTDISLGQMRNHLQRIGENNRRIRGDILGNSNLRDINVDDTSGTILQHATPLMSAMAFLTDEQVNFMDGIESARRDYVRFKNRFLETAVQYVNRDISQVSAIVDEILATLTFGKNETFPWYYSDMVPFGKSQLVIGTFKVTNDFQRIFNLSTVQAEQPSHQAVVVYVNGRQLVKWDDYLVRSTYIEILSSVQMNQDDIVELYEYTNTLGSYIPETPTKLGMYPRFRPDRVVDIYSTDLKTFIQGHDGSQTPAFNDLRDDILLELEIRIYNNIKIDYRQVPLDINAFIPGRYRTTAYTRSEFDSVLNIEFLKYVGNNNVNFTTNSVFQSNNEFTWNYNSATDYAGKAVPGYWRKIYRYFFDTDRPDLTPWEMLGYANKPTWWDNYYAWNELNKRHNLIQAIKLGKTLPPGSPQYNTVTNPAYARPDIEQIVPVDTKNVLLSPQRCLIKTFNSANLSATFIASDGNPAETAWQKSSEYAFALMKTIALLRPVDFFGICLDTNNIRRRQVNGRSQLLNRSNNRRVVLKEVNLNGQIVNSQPLAVASYVNWIHGYLVGLGLPAIETISELLQNTQLNLTYRVSGFTDKKYLEVIADQFSLSSTSQSIVVPNESYDIYLNKNIPIQTAVYSAVIIEPSANGWTVAGYDQKFPYFVIIPSQTNGQSYSLRVLDVELKIFADFKQEKIRVPYGFEFRTRQQVADFLISYQRYLLAQGFLFDQYDPNLEGVRDWSLSIKEFVTWSRQGWRTGNILVLSPLADKLVIYNESAVVDTVDNAVYGSQLIGTNFNVIKNSEFTIIRSDQRTTISTLSGQTIAFARLHLVEFEHIIVFQNTTIFNDVIYKPEVGDRQFRMKLIGSVTANWNGDLAPPGFVYMTGQVDEWKINTDYRRGEIVNYKNRNFSALQDIEGTEVFNPNYWTLLDTVFKSGLAPNFSHNAAKFRDIYDIDSPPLDEQVSTLSAGLIGYKPRDYLDNLGMNKITQLKFYQGYIKEKGTRNAITAISRGYFDNIKDEIEIFEEWGARVGEYGAIDSNPSLSFVIKDSEYDNNPLLYKFTPSGLSATETNFVKIGKEDLVTATEETTTKIFLNRPDAETVDRLWRIEMFGDSVMCGKDILTDEYSVTVNKRYEYRAEIAAYSGYSIIVIDPGSNEIAASLQNLQNFEIRLTTAQSSETIFVTLEPVSAGDVPFQTSYSTNAQKVSNLVPGQPFLLNVNSIQPQDPLFVTLEPVFGADQPETKTGGGALFPASRVSGGDEITIAVTSVVSTEQLYYSFENVEFEEKPLTVTKGLRERSTDQPVCLLDKITGRVEAPPDFLLYNFLDQDFDITVTTRSVEGTSSGDLLAGIDGVNSVWPGDLDSDIIVINHGLTDARRGVPVATYQNNLRELRRRLDKRIVVVWQTPAPVDTTNPNTEFLGGTNDLIPYANAMRQVAWEFGDYIADIAQDNEYYNYIAADGIHPTQQGYRRIVERILGPTVRRAIYDRQGSLRTRYEDDLVTAGYVQDSEVNTKIFDITSLIGAGTTTTLLELATGYKIWVAKDFNSEWQVYRAFECDVTVTGARLDLDNKTVLTLSQTIDIRSGDFIAVRNLDYPFDGFYQVFVVDGLDITVLRQEVSDTAVDTVTDEAGQLFYFQPMRFRDQAQFDASRPRFGWQARNLTVLSGEIESPDYIYIDQVANGKWAVYGVDIIDINYENQVEITDFTSNVYSVLGVDCNKIDTIVRSIDLGGQIQFCLTSLDEIETLYYTIEVPTVLEEIQGFTPTFGQITGKRETVIPITNIKYSYRVLRQQEKIVDITSINNLYLYSNKSKRIYTGLDYYDPAKGKILATARQDLDFITSVDPASYRNNLVTSEYDTTPEYYWGPDQVGTYWWNTDKSRFIDYEHGTLDDRAKHWGELFPGSEIEIYEWIASDYPPSAYVDNNLPGTPLYPDDEFYTDTVYVDSETNTFVNKYFFWVRNSNVKTNPKKTNSPAAIQALIAEPKQQNIPFLIALRDDAVGLYNVTEYLDNDDTIAYISSKRVLNENIIHTDFKLLQESDTLNAVPPRIENKLVDSIVGADVAGNLVPDPALPKISKIGLGIKPRQSLVENYLDARKNVIRYVNSVLIQHPVALRIADKANILSDNFFAAEELPPASSYDQAVDTYNQMFAVNPSAASLRVLVRKDVNFSNYWTVYQRILPAGQAAVIDNYQTRLLRKQGFDVTKYWSYRDWYETGYSDQTTRTYTVEAYKDLYLLNLAVGDIVYVKNNQFKNVAAGNIVTGRQEQTGKFELYKITQVNTGKFLAKLVGLGGGTIQILENLYQPRGYAAGELDVDLYDSTSFNEMRYILLGLKQDIFIGNLNKEWPKLMFMMVEYVLSKQKYIDWFFKTSFVTVKQSSPSLVQYPTIVKNRDQNIQKYIEEVKPYKTKIREFLGKHTGRDDYVMGVTDFDLPAYYDKNLQRFRSPNGEEPELDIMLYQQPEYRDWVNNYRYAIDTVTIASPGAGFIDIPEIEIYRTDNNQGRQANVSVQLDRTVNGISKVYVDDPGTNYTETPELRIIGDTATYLTKDRAHLFTAVSMGYSAVYSPTTFTSSLQTKRFFGLYAQDSKNNLVNNYDTSLLKVDAWAVGAGDAPNYGQNGSLSENQRVIAIDPWSQNSVAWEARPTGTSNEDGGWNTAYFTINPNKLYRSAVWMRRTSATSSGTLYHGLHTNGTGDVLDVATGLSQTDPYWNQRTSSTYTQDEWYLHIGYIFPASYSGTSAHPDSGIYNRSGQKVLANSGNITDAKFPTNATAAMQRVYLNNSSNMTERAQFMYPRWDICDGREPSVEELLRYGPYMSVQTTTVRRGYTLHRIRRSDGIVSFSQTYDVYAGAAGQPVPGSRELARDLNDTTSDYVVVVQVYDEGSIGRLQNNLPDAMYRCGASREVFGSNLDFRFRSAYILVGIPGCGHARGIENYSGPFNNSPAAYCSISFKIEQGHLAALKLDPVNYGFANAFQLPTIASIGQSYTYGDRVYTYNGNFWVNNKIVATTVPTTRSLAPAKLVPQLVNRTIRKAATTIKFDRVQFGSQVQNWQPNRSYSTDTIISYNNTAYRALRTIPANANFDFANVREVGTESNFVSTRYYRNAFFDNANDRIIAYYEPAESNNFVIKELERLVPGINNLYTRLATNTSLATDTILVGDTFGSAEGIASGNIKIQGGGFIDRLFSHAPEELIPGQISDSLSIRVLSNIVIPGGSITTSTTTGSGFGILAAPASSGVEVPFGYGQVTTGQTFSLILNGGYPGYAYATEITAISRPVGSSITIAPNVFSLQANEQRLIQFTTSATLTERTTWYDISPNANHFTLVNQPQFTTELLVGGLFKFDGVQDSANGPLVGANTTAGGYNTVQMWIRWSGDDNGILASFGTGYGLWIRNGYLGFNTGSGDLYGARIITFLNRWIFVSAVFYNGVYTNQSKIYINDVQMNLTQRLGSAASGQASTSLNIAPTSGQALNIEIAEVIVYNRELNLSEVVNNYDETKPRYPVYPAILMVESNPSETFSAIERQ